MKKRVLFVCIGNSCRSQMAEAFARAYGSDVVAPSSAGLSPASGVAPKTVAALREKNIGIEGQFPKDLDSVLHQPFDIVVNMSGFPLSIPGARMLDWDVPDPIGQDDKFFRAVAAQIENLTMRLILELRAMAATDSG
ncbi:MAG TPA: arsenate reductase ArsC [Bryobacteraceae bacterium]|nr:arsenate reductase ArsC [Bryobacteraceae bacterium]